MSKQDVEQRIIDHENLVYFVTRKYFPDLRVDDEIVQSGRIGLWKASEHYDSSRMEFSTFAVRCILNEIKNEIRTRQRAQKRTCAESLDRVVGIDEETGLDILLGHTVPGIEAGYTIVDCDIPSVERRLTPRGAEVFKMYIYGFSPAEISKAYGYSRTWASNLIKDARRIIEKELFG